MFSLDRRAENVQPGGVRYFLRFDTLRYALPISQGLVKQWKAQLLSSCGSVPLSEISLTTARISLTETPLRISGLGKYGDFENVRKEECLGHVQKRLKKHLKKSSQTAPAVTRSKVERVGHL